MPGHIHHDRWAIKKTGTIIVGNLGYRDNSGSDGVILGREEARAALARSYAATVANYPDIPITERTADSYAYDAYQHWGPTRYQVVAVDGPVNVTDRRADDDEEGGVTCCRCNEPMTNWAARCFATDDEAMCCCCYYGDDPDDCSGIGAGYRPVR